MAAVTRPTRSSELDDGPSTSLLSPLDQMRARDEQSKRDAVVLSTARRQAALRALGSLGVLASEPAAPPLGATGTLKHEAPLGAAGEPAPDPDEAGEAEVPLLEITPSQMFAEAERTGERLTIYADRVELRDRDNGLLHRIATADVTDVVVNKRFTGTSVTVEGGSGEPIVARGLKPDQADDIRALILDDRAPDDANGSSDDGDGDGENSGAESAIGTGDDDAAADDEAVAVADAAADAAPETEVAASAEIGAGGRPDADERAGNDERAAEVHVDEADLLAKLAALHDAGVLTDAEYQDKIEVVTQLAGRGNLAITSAPGS
jgi:hypothetical protein